MITKSAKTAAYVNSLIDGASPFLFGSMVLIPFVFSSITYINIETAYYVSFCVVAVLLFGLGILLGKISHKNAYIMGSKTVIAGILVSLLVFILE